MKTRVLEICRERGISLSELAESIGVKQANLSQSLNGNPTLSTLQTVAEAFYFAKTKSQFEDEYKGYPNHLLFNSAAGHLPSKDKIEQILSVIE